VAFAAVSLVDDEIVDPGVAPVVEDALDREASDGNQFAVLAPLSDVVTVQFVLLFLAPGPDEIPHSRGTRAGG